MVPALPVATALYGGLLALLGLGLGAYVIARRMRGRVSFGDGNDLPLQRAMRVLANFAEYVPLALVAMALGEMLGTPRWLAHTLGTALVIGRLLHAQGLGSSTGQSFGRFVGTALTFTVLLVAGIAAILAALRAGVI